MKIEESNKAKDDETKWRAKCGEAEAELEKLKKE